MLKNECITPQKPPTTHTVTRCGDNVIADMDSATGTVLRTYVTPGLDANVSMTDVDASATYYYNQDERQSVMNLTDSTGAVSATYAYSAYGDPISQLRSQVSGLSLQNRYSYTGRESSDVSGDYYFRYRWYGSKRVFNSRDRLGYIDGMSVYAGWFAAWQGIDPYGERDCSKATKPVNLSWDIPESKQYSVTEFLTVLNEPLTRCECVNQLTISAHGNPDSFDLGGDGEDGSDDVGGKLAGSTNYVDPSNAAWFGRKLSQGLCFCKPCTIYILSCNVGINTEMGTAIAAQTGCTVKMPMGWCWSNLADPGRSKIKALDEDGSGYSGALDHAIAVFPPPDVKKAPGSRGPSSSPRSNRRRPPKL